MNLSVKLNVIYIKLFCNKTKCILKHRVFVSTISRLSYIIDHFVIVKGANA